MFKWQRHTVSGCAVAFSATVAACLWTDGIAVEALPSGGSREPLLGRGCRSSAARGLPR